MNELGTSSGSFIWLVLFVLMLIIGMTMQGYEWFWIWIGGT